MAEQKKGIFTVTLGSVFDVSMDLRKDELILSDPHELRVSPMLYVFPPVDASHGPVVAGAAMQATLRTALVLALRKALELAEKAEREGAEVVVLPNIAGNGELN